MSTIITVEQIGLCRKGSDIDLEAVYGGRISQRKQKGLKVNPIYSDSNSAEKLTETRRDHNGNVNGIHVDTYETFPRVKEKVTVMSVSVKGKNLENSSALKDKSGPVIKHVKQNGGVLRTGAVLAPRESKETVKMLKTGTNSNGRVTDGVKNPAYVQNESDSSSKQTLPNGATPIDVSSTDEVKMNPPSTFVTEVHVHSADNSTLVAAANDRVVSDWPELDEITVAIDSSKDETLVNVNNCTDKEKSHADHGNHRNKTPSDSSVSLKTVSVTEIQKMEPIQQTTLTRESSQLKPQVVSVADDNELFQSSEEKQDSGDEKRNEEDKNILSSSTRTLKSILATSSTDTSPKFERRRSKSQSDSQEKSVKFSDDTVFNEDKPKRYRKDKLDKINLRDIYRGKISSDSAVAKMNPLFHDDFLDEDGKGSLTDDEKIAYKLSLKKMMGANSKRAALNAPEYVDSYLVLKTQGLKSSDIDFEAMPPHLDAPVYDRLITRTLAKQRRKLIIKWTLVILTVIIVTAVATSIGVYLSR